MSSHRIRCRNTELKLLFTVFGQSRAFSDWPAFGMLSSQSRFVRCAGGSSVGCQRSIGIRYFYRRLVAFRSSLKSRDKADVLLAVSVYWAGVRESLLSSLFAQIPST